LPSTCATSKGKGFELRSQSSQEDASAGAEGISSASIPNLDFSEAFLPCEALHRKRIGDFQNMGFRKCLMLRSAGIRVVSE
jgi:hypothetical protein